MKPFGKEPGPGPSQAARSSTPTAQLIRRLAHDLNNLLTVVLGSADLLRMHLPEGTPGLGELERIETALQETTSVARAIQTLARDNPGREERLELTSIVERIREVLAHLLPQGIELRVSIPRGLTVQVRGDRTRLEQLLLALLLDARASLGGPGRVHISLSMASVASSPAKDGEAGVVQLEVRAERAAPRDAPAATPTPGADVELWGLETAREIAAELGGDVETPVSPEAVRCFSVRLPAATIPGRAAVAGTAGSRGLVLLIEPDRHVRELVTGALQTEGYTVRAVARIACIAEGDDGALPTPRLIILHTQSSGDPLSPIAALRARGLLGPFLIITAETASTALPAEIVYLREPYAIADLVRSAGQLLHATPQRGDRS